MKRTMICTLLLTFALPMVVLADGAAIYKAKCAACHAANGSGDTKVGKNLKVADLRSEKVKKLSDAQITKVLVEGQKKMPKSKLPPDDIKAVISFIRALK